MRVSIGSAAPQKIIERKEPLVEGVLVRRYKRFLADVELTDGRVVTAHCVNTGAMEGLTEPGNRVWLSHAKNPARRTRFTWELVEARGVLYGANTASPNQIVGELLRAGDLPWLGTFDSVRSEVRYGERSRVDFLLSKPRRELLLEVKNCHLVYPDHRAYFPDSISERASHHLRELAACRTRKRGAAVLFVCQMPGVKAVRPSDVHDPVFAQTAREVRRLGVRFFALAIEHRPTEIRFLGRLPVDLRPYGLARVERWRRDLSEKMTGT